MNDESRRRIGLAQAQLLDALLGGSPAPAGFPQDRVALCALTLQRKRLRTILRLHPELKEIQSDWLETAFERFLQDHPGMPPAGAGADAHAFIALLRKA